MAQPNVFQLRGARQACVGGAIGTRIVPGVRASRNRRVPDLGVTCAPPEPILLIEILSPSNEAETRTNTKLADGDLFALIVMAGTRPAMTIKATDELSSVSFGITSGPMPAC